MLTAVERKHLLDLCSRHRLDSQEIDSSLSYYENKSHLLEIAHVVDHEGLAEAEVERYEAFIEAQRNNSVYNIGAICPKCGGRGSGLHLKWVLNTRKRRYYPYYYFAHSFRMYGKFKVKWHYIKRLEAFEAMNNPALKLRNQ
jgi:hypothetical protein